MLIILMILILGAWIHPAKETRQHRRRRQYPFLDATVRY
jgi:hypothetical protein